MDPLAIYILLFIMRRRDVSSSSLPTTLADMAVSVLSRKRKQYESYGHHHKGDAASNCGCFLAVPS